jgi:hypothetical protein
MSSRGLRSFRSASVATGVRDGRGQCRLPAYSGDRGIDRQFVLAWPAAVQSATRSSDGGRRLGDRPLRRLLEFPLADLLVDTATPGILWLGCRSRGARSGRNHNHGRNHCCLRTRFTRSRRGTDRHLVRASSQQKGSKAQSPPPHMKLDFRPVEARQLYSYFEVAAREVSHLSARVAAGGEGGAHRASDGRVRWSCLLIHSYAVSAARPPHLPVACATGPFLSPASRRRGHMSSTGLPQLAQWSPRPLHAEDNLSGGRSSVSPPTSKRKIPIARNTRHFPGFAEFPGVGRRAYSCRHSTPVSLRDAGRMGASVRSESAYDCHQAQFRRHSWLSYSHR